MERLTSKKDWIEAGKDLSHEYGYSHIWRRLKQIEDILSDDYDLDRLRELVEADKDGRCFISPIKVGQTVWFVRDPNRNPENIIETYVEKIVCKRSRLYIKLACNSMYETACSSIGKTVFLTKEDALKGKENGKEKS